MRLIPKLGNHRVTFSTGDIGATTKGWTKGEIIPHLYSLQRRWQYGFNDREASVVHSIIVKGFVHLCLCLSCYTSVIHFGKHRHGEKNRGWEIQASSNHMSSGSLALLEIRECHRSPKPQSKPAFGARISWLPRSLASIRVMSRSKESTTFVALAFESLVRGTRAREEERVRQHTNPMWQGVI